MRGYQLASALSVVAGVSLRGVELETIQAVVNEHGVALMKILGPLSLLVQWAHAPASVALLAVYGLQTWALAACLGRRGTKLSMLRLLSTVGLWFLCGRIILGLARE